MGGMDVAKSSGNSRDRTARPKTRHRRRVHHISSFMLDSLTLLQRGASAAAAVNLFGQLLAGFALVYIGYRLGVWSQ